MSDLNTLLADGNSSAARRARVRLQPRDKKGRWIPTGAALFASINGIGKVKGKAVGGTATQKGEKNNVRMLVGKGFESQGIPNNTVLTVDPKNAELESKIKLSRDYLKKKGIDPDVQHTLPKSLADMPQDLKDMDPQPADDLDIELANGGLSEAEDEDFRAERSQEPLAKLPPAMEVLEGEEVSDLVDGEQDSTPSVDGDVPEAVVHAAMESAFFGGEPDLDAVINEAKITPEEVGAKDLKRGDIVSLGKQGLRVVTKVDEKNDGTFEVWVKDHDREAKVGRFNANDGFQRLRKAEDSTAPKKPVTEKPARPAKTAKPVPEASPETPPKEKPTPAPEKPKAPAKPAASPRRADDGELIPREELTDEDIAAFRKTKLEGLIDPNGEAVIEITKKGEGVQPRDPNAMLNLLAKTYKNSKFNDRDHLILMRERSNENGKNIEWEIRAAVTGEKKITYMFNFKNLDTGEEQLLLHKDARDSVQSLMGKTNGPETLANILTGKETRRYSATFDTAIHADDVMERSLYFAYQGRTKSIADSAKYYGTGYSQRINYADGTLLEKEVPSIFDAYNKNDRASLEARLRAVFGRMPIDLQSHEEARTALRELFAEKFPEKDKRSFSMAVTMGSESVRKALLDSAGSRATPYSSKDRVTPLEVGMTVEYVNNIDEISVVRVAAKQNTNTAKPSQSDDIFDYGDYVTIVDANGKKSSLPTTSLSILKDQGTPLTDYKARVSGRRLREERGVLYTPGTLMFPGQTSVPDRKVKTEDLVPGDVLYGKNGDNLGVVIESVPAVGKDGKSGRGILYVNRDGDVISVAVADGEERGPKISIGGEASDAGSTSESDPNFDLDSITFETDPATVTPPKTVGLDFNVPSGAKRNAEQQLTLNAIVQKEIDKMAEGLKDALPGWNFDSSSLSTTSFFNAGELAKLLEVARAEYPELSDSEIRTLLELQHAKQRGFFGKTKDAIIKSILSQGAAFKKADGGVRDIEFDIEVDKATDKLKVKSSPSEVADYVKALEDIDKYLSDNDLSDKFGEMNQSIKFTTDPVLFNSLYRSIAGSNPGQGVLGVNIAFFQEDGSFPTTILINGGRLREGRLAENDYFGTPFTHVVAHEFGHTVHNSLGRGFSNNAEYAKVAAADQITPYGNQSFAEHFAESFSKYIQTGQATPEFLDFLRSVGLLKSQQN